jgi:FSR family fosmidomycin resistance protein-like MFS transporter
MSLQIRPTLGKSLILLWSSHLLLDFFTGIWPIYKTIAGIDLAKAGLIAGLSGFFGEFLQLFFGYFSDRGFRKTVIILGLILASCVLWITFTSDILFSFFILLLLMLGSGSYHPAAVGFAGLLSSERKGRNILFFASGGAIGLAISQLAFTKALDLCRGHALIFLIPVAMLIGVIACYPMQGQGDNRRLSFKEFIQPLLRAKHSLVLLYITQVFNFTLITAFMFLLPDLMRSKDCHTWLCMGGGHLCFVLGGAMMMVPAGYLCDKFGHKPVLLIVMFSGLLLLYSFLIHSEHSLKKTILFLTTLGGFMGTVNPIIVSWGNKLVPESPSTVSGLLMGCAWCLANLGAAWAGLLAKAITVEPIVMTLCLLGLLLALGFFLILFVPQVKPAREPTIE